VGARAPGPLQRHVHAPEPGDRDDQAASATVVGVVLDVLAGYDLHGADAIDATRAIRSALHGFIALESSGGFGLPVDINHSFERLVDGLVVDLHTLADPTD